MSENPWLQPKSPDGTPQDPKPEDCATAFFASGDLKNVTQVAERLAAHGGGVLSGELALDLVLNSLVEQARDRSAATGAAIALIRNGELVCRATTGDNSPELGMRVDIGSSLVGDCLRSGQLQQCRDTETDARVNPEACRRLGVRSMLMAPLVDAGAVFGVLQVFSTRPNAFGEREIRAVDTLIPRIAESKREAEAGIAIAPPPAEPDSTKEPMPEQVKAGGDQRDPLEPDIIRPEEGQSSKENEIWSAILVVLVIAAAVLLGLVVGWRGAVKEGASGSLSNPVTPAATGARSAESGPSEAETGPAATPEAPAPASAPAAKASAPASSPPPPTGGLIVTENGKVIYRTPPSVSADAPHTSRAGARPGTWIVHRVEPEYPPEARAQNLQGAVVLDIQIHGDGTVGDVNIASGHPILAKAAVGAVKQWRYQPNFVDGRAVESQARVTIRFTLPPD
jgi:TonB family protein